MNKRASVFIICFVVALFFWFLNSMSSIREGTIQIPLNYIHQPVSYRQIKQLPSYITLYIKASGFSFLGQTISDKNQTADVDVSSIVNHSLDSGIYSAGISSKMILKNLIESLPEEVTVSKTEPDSVSFAFIKNYSKKVEVRLSLNLKLKKQYIQDRKIIIQPDSIEISGPENILQQYSFVETNKISFADASKDLFFSASVINRDTANIFMPHNKVWVLVPINEFTDEIISVAIEKPLTVNYPVAIIPSKVDIVYRTSLRNHKMIRKKNIKAEVNNPEAALEEKKEKLDVIVTGLPATAKLISVKPDRVNYYFIEN